MSTQAVALALLDPNDARPRGRTGTVSSEPASAAPDDKSDHAFRGCAGSCSGTSRPLGRRDEAVRGCLHQAQPHGDRAILVTVVHGIAGMNDMKSVGRVALKSIIYFEVITILALVFGLVAVDLWRPGAGMNIDPALIDTASIKNYVATAHQQTVTGHLMEIIPDTFVSALTEAHVLQVLFI